MAICGPALLPIRIEDAPMRPAPQLILAAAAALALSSCAVMPWNTAHLVGALTGAQEVPPVTTAGTGTLDATYDKSSHKLAYTVTYSGLSGPATAAHFHGPAAPGANAGVVIPFANPASPIHGEAMLTDAQAADLLAGRWYVNVHTRAHPGGEIRSQVTTR
jgi:hypothetical protein